MDGLDHHPTGRQTFGDTFSELVTIKLDSCNSTWHFQPIRMRFRRTLKGVGIPGVSTAWRPYYGLRFDDAFEGFIVLLNPEGTRLLRSTCHQPGRHVCENCAQDPARGISLDDVRQFVEKV